MFQKTGKITAMCKNAGIWEEVLAVASVNCEESAKQIAKNGRKSEILQLCKWSFENYTYMNECYVTQAVTRLMNEENENKAKGKGETEFKCHVTAEFPNKFFVVQIE